jgi:hypothetical protein
MAATTGIKASPARKMPRNVKFRQLSHAGTGFFVSGSLYGETLYMVGGGYLLMNSLNNRLIPVFYSSVIALINYKRLNQDFGSIFIKDM